MTLIDRPSFDALITRYKVTDLNGRLSLPDHVSSDHEQAFLWALQGAVMRATGPREGDDEIHLRAFFTDSLIEWACAHLAYGQAPDLWAEYQAVLTGRARAERELDSASKIITDRDSEINFLKDQAERAGLYLTDALARKDAEWRAACDLSHAQNTMMARELASLTAAYTETASDLAAAQAEIVRLKARLWDMSEAAAQANQ